MTRVLLLLASAIVSAGCSNQSMRGGLFIPADAEARVLVSGREPHLKATNQGPGQVEVVVEHTETATTHTPLQAGQTAYWGFPGGAGVRIQNRSAEPSRVDYVITEARGIELRYPQPLPKGPGAR